MEEDSVRRFVRDNPEMAFLSDRVRVTLTHYLPPPGLAKTRSVMHNEVLAPGLALQTRAAIADIEAPVPQQWANLKLYLELDRIDPRLRESLSGRDTGYQFGPILLTNGATVAGTLDEYLPAEQLKDLPSGKWRVVSVPAATGQPIRNLFSHGGPVYLIVRITCGKGFLGQP